MLHERTRRRGRERFALALLGRDQPLEGRLIGAALRHRRLERALDLVEDRGHRAAVHAQPRGRAAGAERIADQRAVGPQIGRAPAVDRLLGVADQEEPRPRTGGAVEREQAHDVALHRVGVLELVDEQLIVIGAHLRAKRRLVAQQIARFAKQRCVADRPAFAQPLAGAREERVEHPARTLEAQRPQGDDLLDRCAQDRGGLRHGGRGVSQRLPLRGVEALGLAPFAEALERASGPAAPHRFRERVERGHLGGAAGQRVTRRGRWRRAHRGSCSRSPGSLRGVRRPPLRSGPARREAPPAGGRCAPA